MGSNLNPMAKPFHIGSSMLNVEFILSLPKGCSPPPLSSALCFLSSAPHNYEVFMQNKPNLPNAQINVTSVIIANYEDIRPPNPAKTNPIQTQLQKGPNERK